MEVSMFIVPVLSRRLKSWFNAGRGESFRNKHPKTVIS